jgi:Asparagine synthase (glutamine-hydrolyzing)
LTCVGLPVIWTSGGDGRIESEKLAAMTSMLTHRGPDAEGYHVESNIGLGFRRLRIVDLATGDQPLYNEDRSLALICNGEIFNEPDLRRELSRKGHVFRSRSDVEVILHLYEEHGGAASGPVERPICLRPL